MYAIDTYSTMLSIVSTPIGNLGDITLRSLETLKKCDIIVCEDTRVTGKLLTLLALPKKELISFHGYSDAGKLEVILRRLQSGQHICLVSDAGTPGISDPGTLVVAAARDAGIHIEVLPGPSAFLAALSMSGLPIHQCTFLGFLPIKKGRKTLLTSLKEEQRTVVFYESPHRILRTLCEIADMLADQPNRRIVLCRELTKLHEEVLPTTIGALASALPTLVHKGEFTIVLDAAGR